MSDSDDEDSSSKKEAYMTINDIPVYFSEDWNTGIGGGLWSTGLAMAKYFQHHANDVVNNLKGLSRVKFSQEPHVRGCSGISALELGSGNGFLSVCLLAVAAHQDIPLKELVVTDLKDHLELMAKTLSANTHIIDDLRVIQPEDEYGGTNEGHSVEWGELVESEHSLEVIVAEHRWGEFPVKDSKADNYDLNIQNKKYDFIFGTDLAYRNSLHQPLISSLLQFTHQNTICLIGVSMMDTQPRFFDLLSHAGFRYEKLADHLLEREFRGSNFGIIAIQRR